MAKKGLPKMIGTSLSSSISNTMKSIGMINFFTLISTFSRTPTGCFTDLLASCNKMAEDINSFNLSFLAIDKGISETLAPKSHKALENSTSPIVQGIKKIPISLSFGGSLF